MPRPKRQRAVKRVVLYLNPEVHRAIRVEAARDGVSMGEVVERLFKTRIIPLWKPIGSTAPTTK